MQEAGPSEEEPDELLGEAALGVPAGGLQRQSCPRDVPSPPRSASGEGKQAWAPKVPGRAWQWTLAMGVPHGHDCVQGLGFVNW